MTHENQDAAEAFAEVLEAVTMAMYASDKKTTMNQVAAEVLSVLGQTGWHLEQDTERTAQAVMNAETLFSNSLVEIERDRPQLAIALAANGILVTLTELIQQNHERPSAPVESKQDDDTPDSHLWGGKGARG